MSQSFLDNALHRRNKNYPKSVMRKRLLWAALQPLFRLSPRPLYGFRNWLLRAFGAEIGEAVRIYPSVRIFFPWNVRIGDFSTLGPDVRLYSLGTISIADNVLISQACHLCAGSHDYEQRHFPLLTPPINIGSGVWMCADAFVGPNVSIGDNAVIGARAVVMKNIAENAVVAGNPARVLRYRENQ